MLERSFSIGRALQRDKTTNDLVIDTALASEIPYERWWGVEILDMKPESIRLSRMNDGAAVLFNHDPSDLRGTHERGTVRVDADKVMRGRLRITAATQAGRDTIGMVQGEILTKASIGYRIHRVIETAQDKSGEFLSRELDGSLFERTLKRAFEESPGDVHNFQRTLDREAGQFERNGYELPTYRVIDFEPYETSLVPVPADPSVGIGRSSDFVVVQPAAQPAAPAQKGATMQEQQTAAAGATAETRSAEVSVGVDFAAQEKARKETIKYVCARADIPEGQAAQWILEGVAIEEAQRRAMEVLAERHKDIKTSAANVGLSSRETQQYSLFRMIEAIANQNPAKAGLEFEVHKTMQAKLNRLPNERSFFLPSDRSCTLQPVGQHARDERRTFYVPAEVLQRDLSVGTANAGGYLVETANQGFIEMLRNRSVAMALGATRLTGLQGSITVPKQTAAATAYWLASESTQITESQQTLGQMALTPKNVGAYTEISRQLLLQSSPSAEAMVMNDLARVIALAVDAASLEGSGSGGQPTGISATGSIGSVSGTSLAAAGILEFQSDVAGGNVVPMRPGYATTPAVAAKLMARPELPSTGTTRLWTGSLWNGGLFTLPAMSSNQLTADTMIFGDWSELVVAEWGVLEIEVNPFANFQAGIRGVRCMYTVDVGVRYAAAFSRATSIT